VMSGKRWPMAVAAVVVGFFAIFHGHAHGAELPAGQSVLIYSLGFVVATGFLHLLGILIGSIRRWPNGASALRFAGSGVALFGAFFLWRAVA
jgi:urease accessory protein